jgi:hypothetical protein
MPKTHFHGTGARHRVIPPEEEIFGAHLAGIAPDFTKSTGLVEPPDEDQGSSNSCTSQSFGYHFWQLTGCQVLRNDIYSHTFLPGGGAYLTSPADFAAYYGTLLRNGQYQEPSPETEASMETVVLALNAQGRIKTYEVARIVISPNINTVASLLEQYKGITIGIDGNDSGWQNMTDPTYNGHTDWGHALYVYDRAVRNGRHALKAKSSWCNEAKDHFINDIYFNAGGVFEALAITVKELTMTLVNDNGTWKLVGDKGFIGIADPAALLKIQAATSETSPGPVTVPQVGVFKSVNIDKETNLSVLVND